MAINNNIDSGIPIEISKGGTNTSSLSLTYGVLYYDGSKLMTVSSLGVNPQVLTSNGSAPPTFQSVSPSGPVSAFIQSLGSTNYVTGDGMVYLPYFNQGGINVGGDFDGSGRGVYTAPLAGKYYLECEVVFYDDVHWLASSYNLTISTSNREYSIIGNPYNEYLRFDPAEPIGYRVPVYAKPVAAFADMDASDIAYIWVKVSGTSRYTSVWSRLYSQATSAFTGYIIGT